MPKKLPTVEVRKRQAHSGRISGGMTALFWHTMKYYGGDRNKARAFARAFFNQDVLLDSEDSTRKKRSKMVDVSGMRRIMPLQGRRKREQAR